MGRHPKGWSHDVTTTELWIAFSDREIADLQAGIEIRLPPRTDTFERIVIANERRFKERRAAIESMQRSRKPK